jgi:transposase
MTDRTNAHRSPRRYPAEIKERAVRMVFDAFEGGDGEQYGTITRIARQLDIGTESLRSWVRQAEIDRGAKAGTTSEDKKRIGELEKQVRELRRANEILKAAAGFFARELDPRLPR